MGTYGDSGAPSQSTYNFDAVFATSLANYKATLLDNISLTNAFFYKMIKSSQYESYDGGTTIDEQLMYALAKSSWYDGYDELGDTPTDGLTKAQFDPRQMAVPIIYSFKEQVQNRRKIVDLVKAKMQQAELGIKEDWATAWWQGAGSGSLATPLTDPSTGASAIDPIAKLVHFTPSTSLSVGNINQSTSTWWRNKTQTSAATTYEGFLIEMDHMYNTVAQGVGGPPDLIVTDQTTYELFVHAYFAKYRTVSDAEPNFPFEAKRFKKAIVVWDEKMHDVYSGTTDTGTYGTMYFLNTQFFKIRYLPERDFSLIADENGKTFKKPLKGDSRLGHMGWMGATTINNRRKQGVLGKIARTLS